MEGIDSVVTIPGTVEITSKMKYPIPYLNHTTAKYKFVEIVSPSYAVKNVRQISMNMIMSNASSYQRKSCCRYPPEESTRGMRKKETVNVEFTSKFQTSLRGWFGMITSEHFQHFFRFSFIAIVLPVNFWGDLFIGDNDALEEMINFLQFFFAFSSGSNSAIKS
jgi:hypothetical protein